MASGSQLNKTTATLPVECAVLFGDFRADELVMTLDRVVPAFTAEWLPLPPDHLGYDILDVKMDQSSRSTNDVANDSSASQHGGSTVGSGWSNERDMAEKRSSEENDTTLPAEPCDFLPSRGAFVDVKTVDKPLPFYAKRQDPVPSGLREVREHALSAPLSPESSKEADDFDPVFANEGNEKENYVHIVIDHESVEFKNNILLQSAVTTPLCGSSKLTTASNEGGVGSATSSSLRETIGLTTPAITPFDSKHTKIANSAPRSTSAAIRTGVNAEVVQLEPKRAPEIMLGPKTLRERFLELYGAEFQKDNTLRLLNREGSGITYG